VWQHPFAACGDWRSASAPVYFIIWLLSRAVTIPIATSTKKEEKPVTTIFFTFRKKCFIRTKEHQNLLVKENENNRTKHCEKCRTNGSNGEVFVFILAVFLFPASDVAEINASFDTK